MRIFIKDDKNNFVDENNVFLGYDDYDDCCSDGGWFLADKPDEWLKDSFKEEPMDLPGWIFDTKYFRKFSSPEHDAEDDSAQFRIVNGNQEKFITLYNLHNGYYGKGFEFKIGDQIIKDDTL